MKVNEICELFYVDFVKENDYLFFNFNSSIEGLNLLRTS